MNERDRVKPSILLPFVVVLIIWIVFYFDFNFKLHLSELGILPRSFSSLPGIIIHFFIHADFQHIFSNSFSLLILLLLLFVFYETIALRVFLFSLMLSGTGVWLFGRANENGAGIVHIGSSTVIFSLFGFLFLSGILRKNRQAMALSGLVIFLYGYFVWGLFPIQRTISWEGHISGFISGLILALFYRKSAPQPDAYPLLDIDEYDNLPDEQKFWLQNDENKTEENQDKQNEISVRYFYNDGKKGANTSKD